MTGAAFPGGGDGLVLNLRSVREVSADVACSTPSQRMMRMRPHRFAALAALMLTFAACAGGPPPEPAAPPPFNPAGTYDFSMSIQGQSLDGVLVIAGTPEAGFTASVSSQMGETDLGRVRLMDRTMTFTIPEVDASGEVVFEGEGFTGAMSTAMGSIPMNGTRRN